MFAYLVSGGLVARLLHVALFREEKRLVVTLHLLGTLLKGTVTGAGRAAHSLEPGIYVAEVIIIGI